MLSITLLLSCCAASFFLGLISGMTIIPENLINENEELIAENAKMAMEIDDLKVEMLIRSGIKK